MLAQHLSNNYDGGGLFINEAASMHHLYCDSIYHTHLENLQPQTYFQYFQFSFDQTWLEQIQDLPKTSCN